MKAPSAPRTDPHPHAPLLEEAGGQKPVRMCRHCGLPLGERPGQGRWGLHRHCQHPHRVQQNAVNKLLQRLREEGQRLIDAIQGSGRRRVSGADVEQAIGEMESLRRTIRPYGPLPAFRPRAQLIASVLSEAFAARAIPAKMYAQALELVRDCGASDPIHLVSLSRNTAALWAHVGDCFAVARQLMAAADACRIGQDRRGALYWTGHVEQILRMRLRTATREEQILEHEIAVLRHRLELDLPKGTLGGDQMHRVVTLAQNIDDPVVWWVTRIEAAADALHGGDRSRAEAELAHVVRCPANPDLLDFEKLPEWSRLGAMRPAINFLYAINNRRRAGSLIDLHRSLARRFASSYHVAIEITADWGVGREPRLPLVYLPLFGYLEWSDIEASYLAFNHGRAGARQASPLPEEVHE